MFNLNASSKVLLCFMYNTLYSETFSFLFFFFLIKLSIVCLLKIIDSDIQHYKVLLIAGMVLITYLIPQSREYWKACSLIRRQTTYSNINFSTQFLQPLTPTVFCSVLQLVYLRLWKQHFFIFILHITIQCHFSKTDCPRT